MAVVGLVPLVSGDLPAEAAPPGPVAWLGSPVSGSVTSPPPSHHRPYGGHWSVDLSSPAGQNARVYVAVDSARDSRLSTKILKVDFACGASPWDSQAGPGNTAARRLSRGGKVVVVGVYFDGSLIGKIWYSHLETSRRIGTYNEPTVRWGGVVGTVGNYHANYNTVSGQTCWDGTHVHLEAKNVSGLSCYWAGLTQGRTRSRSQYLGYVGYRSPTPACPAGI